MRTLVVEWFRTAVNRLTVVQSSTGSVGYSWYGYVAATLLTILSNAALGLAIGFWPNVTNLVTLNLISVLVVAIAFGRGPAIWAAVCSFLIFNWFFVQPLHTLAISGANEWIVLFVFLLTAVTTGQLAAGQRERTREAERRERETVVLYDSARLLGEPGTEQAMQTVAERLCRELGFSAVSIEWPEDSRQRRVVAGTAHLIPDPVRRGSASLHVLTTGALPSETQRGEPGRWVRVVPPQNPVLHFADAGLQLRMVPIKVAQETVGQIVLLQRSSMQNGQSADRVVSAVADLIGITVERARLRREATETEILRRAEELRTALLNSVSHDLRTPLSSIVASAGSLRRRDVSWSDLEREEFAGAIEEEATRLNRIVGNLLDLSRLEAGALKPQRDWYDFGALVDDVIGRIKPLASGHELRVDVPEDLPPISIDYVEIDQVLTNLLENAVKYSPVGGTILLRANPVEGELQVEVVDEGPGIPAAEHAMVFEPFYRASGMEQRPPGTGLGLAVARGLVLAHRGRIWVESRRSKGCRFVFTLPLPESDWQLAKGEVSKEW